jgi:hypothetical protein
LTTTRNNPTATTMTTKTKRTKTKTKRKMMRRRKMTMNPKGLRRPSFPAQSRLPSAGFAGAFTRKRIALHVLPQALVSAA